MEYLNFKRLCVYAIIGFDLQLGNKARHEIVNLQVECVAVDIRVSKHNSSKKHPVLSWKVCKGQIEHVSSWVLQNEVFGCFINEKFWFFNFFIASYFKRIDHCFIFYIVTKFSSCSKFKLLMEVRPQFGWFKVRSFPSILVSFLFPDLQCSFDIVKGCHRIVIVSLVEIMIFKVVVVIVWHVGVLAPEFLYLWELQKDLLVLKLFEVKLRGIVNKLSFVNL